jgi:hypothetical protein
MQPLPVEEETESSDSEISRHVTCKVMTNKTQDKSVCERERVQASARLYSLARAIGKKLADK